MGQPAVSSRSKSRGWNLTLGASQTTQKAARKLHLPWTQANEFHQT